MKQSLWLFVAVVLALASPSCEAVRIQRVENKKYPPQQRHRGLDHKGSKGKSSKDKDGGTGVTGASKTTTAPTTAAPTVSAAPSVSKAPSASPTISPAPTKQPSSAPTETPTSAPTGAPSSTPTTAPTAAPSVSPAPTESPYKTNNALPSTESTCENPIPTDDISPLISQLFAYQVEVQIDRTLYSGTDADKAAESEALVHAQLAKALLGDCTFTGAVNSVQFTRIDSYAPDTIVDVKTDGICPTGVRCYDMDGDFVADFFMQLPADPAVGVGGPGVGGPSDEDTTVAGVGGPPSRRHLQDTPAPVQLTIENAVLMAQIGTVLREIYGNLDTGDGTKFIFKGFTNPAALETTGDGDTPTNRGPDGVGALENAPQALAKKGNGAIAGLVLGCAAIVLIVVSVLSLQRKRESKKFMMDHMALEDDEYYDDDDDDDFYHDDEAQSNPKDILADLYDQEEASMAAGTTYSSRKVYVLSDQDSASASHEYLGSNEYVGSAGSYRSRFGGEPSQSQTTFIKALSKSTLSDLGPTNSYMSANRSFVAEDTVDL